MSAISAQLNHTAGGIFLRSKAFRDVSRPLLSSRYMANLYFVSSNIAKISHIEHLFTLYGLPVKIYRRPLRQYEEKHDLDPLSSVIQSVRYVSRAYKHLGLFFIEDSSFSLEAFSRPGEEFPGLATKAFLNEHSFARIDSLLRSKGNDRRATLISRIGLHLPGGSGIEVFTGTTQGMIARTEAVCQSDSGVPWLGEISPANFFVPDGCKVPLSSLALEVSYNYDTRLRALHQLLFRIAQFAKVAEHSNVVFRRRREVHFERQLRLFVPFVLIVSGYSGAGKTTAALYLSRRFGLQYFEESDALRAASEDDDSQNGDLSEFCNQKVARGGSLYFIEYLLDLHRTSLERPFIISGVRNPDEVDYVKALFPGSELIFLDVPLHLRYARCSLAGYPLPKSDELLRRLDAQESRWGMENIKRKADHLVHNTGNLQALFVALDQIALRA